MSENSELANVQTWREILSLEDGDVDEDLGITLTSFIITAVHEKAPQQSLSTIVEALKQSRCACSLEPLTIIPIVINILDGGADELMNLLSQECSAKEVVMAVEEVVESLVQQLRTEDEPEEVAEEKSQQLPVAGQVVRLVRAYAATIPRLPQWKKSPRESMKSRLSELESVISLVGREASPEEGRALITVISQLVLVLGNTADEQAKELLRHIIEHTLETFANTINAGLARKAFAMHFPRLVVPEPEGSLSSHEDIIASTWSALHVLGIIAESYKSRPSLASFILLAHDSSYTFSESHLTAFFPIVLSSIQTNVALDEVLAALTSSLASLRKTSPRPELGTILIVPLVHLLPHLASNHPDQNARHYTFRILGLVLALSPAALRCRLIKDLLSDGDLPPQMHVAAVSLLKEAVLEGLSSQDKNVFASPHLLATFGPIVLQPHPPDLFDSVQQDEFLESAEPLRLVECLGFYYVLLMRDVQNRTGVRDADSLRNVQHTLLHPMRSRLKDWHEDTAKNSSEGHDHDGAMQLDILDMWLERAQSAIDDISR